MNDSGTSVLQARMAWGGGLAPVAMWRKMPDSSVKLFYFVTDGQESVRQLTDAAGMVTDSYYYDAWGTALAGGSGDTANPFRYTGQMLDSSGKYFLRARYYDPATGRFLSHDPMMGSASDPVSMHRYLYASADAVNYADPTGKFSLGGTMTAINGQMALAGTYAQRAAPVVGSAMAFVGSIIFVGNFAQHIAKSLDAGVSPFLPDGIALSFSATGRDGSYSLGGAATVYMDRESREIWFSVGVEGSVSVTPGSGRGVEGGIGVGFTFNTRNGAGKTDAVDALSGFGFSATFPFQIAQFVVPQDLRPYFGIAQRLSGAKKSVTLSSDVPYTAGEYSRGEITQDIAMSFGGEADGISGGFGYTDEAWVKSARELTGGARQFYNEVQLQTNSLFNRAEQEIKAAYGVF